MIMDPLMMWPLLIWIYAVMLGRLYEYSEALFLKERLMVKVTLEGNRGQGSSVYSAFKSASIISKITVKIPENQSKTYQRPLLLICAVTSGFLYLYEFSGSPWCFKSSTTRM